LKLAVSEPGALVTVDGKSRGVYAAPLRLAGGVHRLLIERGGFRSLERDVNVQAGTTTTVSIALEPTPETRQIYVDHAMSTRTWSWIGIAGGAALVGGGIGIVAASSGAKADAQAELDAKLAQRTNKAGICDIANGGDPDICNRMVDDAQSKVNSAKTRSTIGYFAAGVGGAVAAVGLVWLITGDDPHRLVRKPAGSTDIAKTLVPVVGFGQGAASFSIRGTF
jgi:hypothetical protein